jgi:hypothetical protein
MRLLTWELYFVCVLPEHFWQTSQIYLICIIHPVFCVYISCLTYGSNGFFSIWIPCCGSRVFVYIQRVIRC